MASRASSVAIRLVSGWKGYYFKIPMQINTPRPLVEKLQAAKGESFIDRRDLKAFISRTMTDSGYALTSYVEIAVPAPAVMTFVNFSPEEK